MSTDAKVLEKIHEMADMGVPDKTICEKLNLSSGYVSVITTKYWKDKMKNKE